MRTILLAILVTCGGCLIFAGCGGKVGGPRFWWDDRNQERLPDDYRLPGDAEAQDAGNARGSAASGEDLSDDDLRDYRTNLDQQEEKRKSEASLLDF